MEIQKKNVVQDQDQNSVAFIFPESRQSHFKINWEKVISAIQVAGVEKLELTPGMVISAADAVGWSNSQRTCDIRPRLQGKLIDSGSMISATVKQPGDKLDNTINLVAVNGSRIKTYGVREIVVKIGRKPFRMPAIVCDISQDILGMDFLYKFRLGLDWDDEDQSKLCLIDKKSKIKAELEIVTVPNDIQRTHCLEAKADSPGKPLPETERHGHLP